MYAKYLKRVMDLICSSVALIVLSPILLIVSVLVKIYLGSPILFKQSRVGLNEKVFILYKFRTMTKETDECGELLPDGRRLTKFGKLLRSTSLDELPQLFNIIKGDMSIIGPRPLLVEYLNLYNAEQRRRHDVRPGLSDLSAIRGRSNVSWEEQFEHDIEYINNLSLTQDIKIIIMTVITVIKREGVSQEGHATRESFKGIN